MKEISCQIYLFIFIFFANFTRNRIIGKGIKIVLKKKEKVLRWDEVYHRD